MKDCSKHLRRARDSRRQIILGHNLSLHENSECESRRKVSTNMILKTSAKDRCLSAQILKFRFDKEVYKNNTLEKIAKFETERKQEFRMALENEQTLASIKKILCSATMEKKHILHNVLLVNNKEIKFAKHFLVCKRIVGDIIDLSVTCSELKEFYNGNVPGNIYNEKLDLFLMEIPSFPQGLACHNCFEFLSQLDFHYYLNKENVWKCPNLTIKSSTLNVILSQIFDIAYPDMMVTELCPPFFPQFSLKVCVLGGPYSGKSTCCQMLSSVFKLQVISVSHVVSEAIEAFENSESISFESENVAFDKLETSVDEAIGFQEKTGGTSAGNSVTKRLTLRAELGRQAVSNLELGCAVKDEFVVDMLIEYIRRIPEDGSGWIIDGFPCTLKQLEMLELALTGCNPKDDIKKSFKSQILTLPEIEKNTFKSAIDVVLIIDVPDNVIVNRSQVIHGSNDDMMNGLENDNMHVLQSLELYKNEVGNLIEWFRKFSRLEFLNGCKDTAKMGIKILNETMIQLSLAKIEIKKSLEENYNMESLIECPSQGGSRDRMDFNMQIQKFPLDMSQESANLILELWEQIEDNYVMECHTVLKWLRNDNQELIAHCAKIRNNFKGMIKKPNCMQVYMLQFQKEFNLIPSTVRENGNVKAELCQKVDDLQVELWKLSDEKLKKFQSHICLFSNDQYLTSCMCSINNHLLQLVQIEVSKLQNVWNLLKDVLCYSRGNFDLAHFENVTFKSFQNEEMQQNPGIAKKTEFPDEKRNKLKSRKESGSCQSQGFSNYLSSAKAFLTKMNEFVESMRQDSSNENDSSENKSKSRVAVTSQLNIVEGNKDDLVRDFSMCMKSEIACTNDQIDIIENVSMKYTELVQTSLSSMLNIFNKWISTNYLLEMQSIDLACEVLKNCSEHGCLIKDLLTIESGNFFMDESFSVPVLFHENDHSSPTFLPSQSSTSGFSVHQLFCLLHKFMDSFPAGLISKDTFRALLQQASCDGGLPNNWVKDLPEKIDNATCTSIYEEEFVNWRKFLLLSTSPSWPTEKDMLDALSEFRKFDQLCTGKLTKEQFLKTNVWINKGGSAINGFLFELFACHQNIPPLLDYATFLLSFCLEENSLKGLQKALKLASAIENAMHGHPTSEKSCVKNEEILSAQMLHKVLYPLPLVNQKSRFFHKECKMAELLLIYKDLGAKTISERLPIRLLTEHEPFQRISQDLHKFWLDVDFQS